MILTNLIESFPVITFPKEAERSPSQSEGDPLVIAAIISCRAGGTNSKLYTPE
jgi:hypothetical protein